MKKAVKPMYTMYLGAVNSSCVTLEHSWWQGFTLVTREIDYWLPLGGDARGPADVPGMQ
jgi:hypothetical protein